jgi:CO dehydrogenase/acetyl-CoA synthase beta subunit
MKVIIQKGVHDTESYIEGVEFYIDGDKVWIQIGYNYVAVDKDELVKVLKLVE